MTKRHKKGIPLISVLLMSILSMVLGVLASGYLYLNEQKLASQDEVEVVREAEIEETTEAQPTSQHHEESDVLILPKIEINLDKNGDGIEIEHIYASTYEGYMMVVHNPEDVSIAINPYLGNGAAAPELEDYVEMFEAAGGINGGGFADEGGTGNGSVPAGIVIMDGKLVSGGAPQPILGITKDHKLITTTCSGQEALDMGIVEAVTFGPTFINNGQVVYQPGTDNLNMLNPRTAVGQKADGTFLLLVIDGRGPSSFGAKYEDVVEIFLEYEAVMAGNLDGGNSSVMIYDDKYIHYPVSMYDSRNLPSVVLVKAKK